MKDILRTSGQTSAVAEEGRRAVRPDMNASRLPETALTGCWLYLRHNAGLVAHWKKLSPPLRAFPDFTHGAA